MDQNKQVQFARAFFVHPIIILLIVTIFASVLIFSLNSNPLPAYAVTSAEKQAEADELIAQLDRLQTDLDNTRVALDEATVAEQTAQNLMDQAQAQEQEASALSTDLQDKLAKRAREQYCNGDVGYLDVIFGSSSFSQFLTNWDMLSRIAERDADLTSEAKQAKQNAENARLEYTEQESIAAEKKNEIAELEADLSAQSEAMQAEIQKLNDEVAELLAQEEAAAEAARLAAAAAASGGSNIDPEIVTSMSGMVHPCPSGYISSSFGWRDFDSSFHKGLDFAAGTGTPIQAAYSGTVIISGYSASAGYWVVISHGNGVITKYMHAYTQPYVSAGQYVTAGEVIAGVGNTGNSFGAHLHFQVEINGAAVDPYPFLY